MARTWHTKPSVPMPAKKQTIKHRDATLPALSIADLATCGRALTVADLEQVFSVHKLTLYRMAREGRIPGAFRIGTCLRFDPRKVAAAFLEVR